VLLGRDHELEELAGLLTAAKAGNGGLLLLSGEAGVGKTRLAEAAISAGGVAARRGVAAQRRSAPYAPIAGALRAFLRSSPEGLAELGPLRAQLGVLLPELGARPKSSERETLFEAIRLAFETVARAEPTVVFLDDLQWADAATLELLPSLAASAEEWPLLLLGAYRSEEIPRGHPLRRLRTDLRRGGRLAELVVEPLGPASTAALAATVLGAEPGPTLGAALFDRTQGVPFFVEELAAALKVSSSLVSGRRGLELESGVDVPIPDTIRDAVRLRTEDVSPSAEDALQAAAVAGTRFELDLLSSLGEDAGLGEALEHGLLVELEPGVAAFRHDLAREALYADTPWPRRRSLHRALAELLESRGAEPGLVADHWVAAGERVRARPLLVEAARRYCALHAYRDAAAAGRAALELWPEGADEPGRLDVLDQLGRCAELCGELTEAVRAWEEVAAGSLEDADRLAETKRRLAAAYELQGAASKAAATRIEAADLFAEAGRIEDAAAERLEGAARLFREDPAASRDLCRQAHEEAVRAGRRDLESRSLRLEGFMASVEGRLDDALELLRSAVSLALEGSHVQDALMAYWAIGAVSDHWADYPAAQSALEEAVGFCRSNGLHPDEEFCMSCLAVVLRHRGAWNEAEEISREVLASSATEDVARAHALGTLGFVSAARGATARARPLLRQALAIARDIPLPGTECESAFGLALADELDRKIESRWDELVVAAAAERSEGHYAPALRWAATGAARRGEAALVHASARAAAEIAARFASADVLAALAYVLGEVALLEGDAVRAAEQFDQALELFRDVDAPFERAHMQLRAGVVAAAAGERQVGVERIVDAYRTFRKLGARPMWLRAAAELEALGEPVDRRLGRRAARELEHGGLTRRELEILRLVAVGRTNREIARDLFLSPRTVEMHVRNVLSKLGCRSRTEATGKAHELGLVEPVATR
jgi:DNA-binding CsgD family transcriptional regulator/tetratricopeptide (TPR) repeat protein